MNYFWVLSIMGLIGTHHLYAQIESPVEENHYQDSLYILEIEDEGRRTKVMHAEPLYIDLIRDLGARKGEKEWNVGMGIIDNQSFDKYEALVEYEWAPIDRLGLEVELPFSFYYSPVGKGMAPASQLNALKLAAQYTFLVDDRRNFSLALGYIQELEITEFRKYGSDQFIPGAVYNPFLIVARRWGNNFHTLLYSGPVIEHHFRLRSTHIGIQVNTNVHYMISGTRNFVGIEFNKEVSGWGDFDMTIRPQMRVSISDQLLVGIVTGIPISRENQRFSSFLRLIYEPGHRH